MKQLIFILFLIVAVVAQTRAETFRGRVMWIHDGDTVTVNSTDGKWYKVRLWGIDAPEAGQPYGREATLALIRLAGRKLVTVEIKDTDKYERVVGILRYGKLDLNLEMVKIGAAWYYSFFAPDAEDLAKAEKLAREEKKGLWALPDPVPPWEWRKKQKKADAPARKHPDDGNQAVQFSLKLYRFLVIR